MIKAIVFDIGGVLLRTEDHSGRLQLQHQYHLPDDAVEALVFESEPARLSTIGKAPQSAVWLNVAKTLDLSQSELETFRSTFWSGDYLDTELVEFLKSCRPKYKTALLSNAWEGSRADFESNYGLTEGVVADKVLISAELGVAKPSYRIYDILRSQMACAFSEILFVDDISDNIESANQLGIQTIQYRTGMNVINQIKSLLESNTR